MNVIKPMSLYALIIAALISMPLSSEPEPVIVEEQTLTTDQIPPTICPPQPLPPCPSCSTGPSSCGPITGKVITDGFVSKFVPVSPGNPDLSNCQRLFNVYLPELFFTDPTMTFPIVYHLTGFGGNNTTYSATDAFVMDTMIAAGQAVPMIIVAPDPTIVNYQDSWYVDSKLNGLFERYIIEELIPFVDKKYRQKTDGSGKTAPFRAIMGQSMGGYGSLYYGIKYPNLFSAYAGDSPTSFWVYNTNRASPPSPPEFPDGNPVYSYTVDLIQKVIDNGGVIDPSNVPPDDVFSFYSYAGAFSPVTGSFVPPIDPAVICSTTPPSCLSNPPFCVDLPILLLPMTPATPSNPVIVPTSLGPSFVENPPVRALWETFDPYNFLTNPAITNPDILKRQAIYLDAGADLALEPVDNVGAFYFSKALTELDVNNEYVLFQGGHTTGTTCAEIGCYRFTTNLKLFSGKFSEAGIFAPDVRMKIAGDMLIELTDSAVMSINNKRLVGIETDPDNPMKPVTSTNVTIRVLDSARLELGTPDIIGGGLQVGNAFGKANLLFEPSRATNSIIFTLEIDGPGATVQIGKQGFLGFGVGIDGNQTAVSNFWGLSSLTNVDAVTVNLQQGRFLHNEIASSLDPNGSLLALGAVGSGGYTWNINPTLAVQSGGGNIAMMTEANRIHPTVQDIAGTVDPGGIRNCLVKQPATIFDCFYGPPKGFYASSTYSQNLMAVDVLSSSPMLFDIHKAPLPSHATQEQLFIYLSTLDYFTQGTKEASIATINAQLVVDYLTPGAQMQEIIHRPVVDTNVPCSSVSPSLNLPKVLDEGAVGVKLATINGIQQIIRLYDLDPVIA